MFKDGLPICIWLAREHHIRNSNKNHLVNAVELSLQLDRNTQHRTNIILFIFLAAFGTPLSNIYDRYIIWGIMFLEYFNKKLLCLVIFTSPRTSLSGISTCPTGSMYESDKSFMAILHPWQYIWYLQLYSFILIGGTLMVAE